MTPFGAWICDPWGLTSVLLVLCCVAVVLWAWKAPRRMR